MIPNLFIIFFVCLVSSQATKNTFFRIFNARDERSFKLPIGVETNNNEHAASVGKLVAKVVQIIESEPSGTNIEGEMDVVLKVLQDCHMSLHNEHGVPRVSTTVKIGTRIDKFSTLEDKINTVNKELGR